MITFAGILRLSIIGYRATVLSLASIYWTAAIKLFRNLLLNVDWNPWKPSVKPFQLGEESSAHISDCHQFASTSFDVDFLQSQFKNMNAMQRQSLWKEGRRNKKIKRLFD